MNVLSLFSGVGMMDYGLERAGFNTVAFCEIEPWPRRVLNKHWPDVPVYEDVRELNRERLEEDGVISDTIGKPEGLEWRRRGQGTIADNAAERPYNTGRDVGHGEQKTGCVRTRTEDTIGSIEVIVGGWPCQDLSVAGKQAGIHDGKRSGLWSECARLVSELRPKYAIFENVGALLSGGDLVDTPSGPVYRTWFGRVLRDLAEIGYDCEWHCIPAGNPDGLSAGAPHRRERIWIVAYPMWHSESNSSYTEREIQEGQNALTDNTSKGRERDGKPAREGSGNRETAVANTNEERPQGERSNRHQEGRQGQNKRPAGLCNGTDYASRGPTEPSLGVLADGIAARLSGSRWLPEPPVGRVATGVPDRVQKLKALGNGLVWQIPYAIGCAIMERES